MYLYSIYSSVSAIAKKLEGLPGWIAGGKLVGFAKERSWKKFQANILNVKVENVADYLSSILLLMFMTIYLNKNTQPILSKIMH